MKRSFVVGGTIGAVVLLVLAMFPSVVSAQSSTSIAKDNGEEDIKEIQKLVPPGWYPGWLIDIMIILLINLLYLFD